MNSEKTSLDIIRAHLHLWDGNDTAFGRLLHERTGDRNDNAWRCIVQRFFREHPDEMPKLNKDNPNDLIPEIWDGTSWADLARVLKQKRPDISLKGWNHRIVNARAEGRLTRAHKKEFYTEHFRDPRTPSDTMWTELEAKTTDNISGYESARWADVHFPPDKHIGVAIAADQHIGNRYTDHARMREDAELIASSPNTYALLAGDFIDNFLAPDKPSPAASQMTYPDAQWKLLSHYVDMFDGKILAVVSGNHEQWTKKYAGVDILDNIMAEKGIVYHTDELNIRIFLGSLPYHFAMRHKRRGNAALNPARVVKKMWEDGETDFDVGIVAHNHVPVIEPFTKHGIERWAVRPGSYKIVDSFSEMIGFAADKPTCPLVIISPHTRDIQVFSDLRTGLLTLESLNK